MEEFGVGKTGHLSLRVSAATLARVCFKHPGGEQRMLVLERTATHRSSNASRIEVIAKPIGGGVRMMNPSMVQDRLGLFHFDSQRSFQELDFRIYIAPEDKEKVIRFCLEEFMNPEPQALDCRPEREVMEELYDSLGIMVNPEQFEMTWLKVVVEPDTKPSSSPRALGVPSIHIYNIFRARIIDDDLIDALLNNSQQHSDEDLRQQARIDLEQGGWGRANAVLTLPLPEVETVYQSIPLSSRDQDIMLDEHCLTSSVRHLLDYPAEFDTIIR
jgi:hypothetical protein